MVVIITPRSLAKAICRASSVTGCAITERRSSIGASLAASDRDHRVLKDAEVKQRFNAQGFEPQGSTPEALGELLALEAAKYARVIQQSGMKID